MIVVLAAALWLVYLVPLWRRRRDFVATARNTIRLQQTLRILAETSEIPNEVRLEATSRVVAQQQRTLRRFEQREAAKIRAQVEADAAAELRARYEAERSADEAVAREQAALAAIAARSSAQSVQKTKHSGSKHHTRRRRGRSIATLLLTVSVIGVIAGLPGALEGGIWLVPILSSLAGAGAIVLLVRLARPAPGVATAPARNPVTPRATELYDDALHEQAIPDKPRQQWTPKPLPKPLHLSPGTIAAAAMASADAAAEARRAAARVELDRRAEAQVAPSAPAQSRPAAAVSEQRNSQTASGAESRYARMGVVDPNADGTVLDLDAVLRRRRAAS